MYPNANKDLFKFLLIVISKSSLFLARLYTDNIINLAHSGKQLIALLNKTTHVVKKCFILLSTEKFVTNILVDIKNSICPTYDFA